MSRIAFSLLLAGLGAALVGSVLLATGIGPVSALPLGWGLHGIFLAWIGWWFGWLFIRYRQNAWRTRLRTADTGP